MKKLRADWSKNIEDLGVDGRIIL